ncbi:MAG TPA: ABC transporter ATP-binding protein [Dehalococcoidia bacterium]|nr:ABC transporter ATP-binding protein [Dehalococcoidia bacterium]
MGNGLPPQVEARGLTKTFRNNGRTLTALADVSLSVVAGEFVAVIGPSGCGKTTLLRAIGGLLAPTSGSVRIGGESPTVAGRAKQVGYVFQDASLLPWRTVIQNVRLPLEVNRRSRASTHLRPERLLELMRLEEFRDYYPRQLSGGMQQRVALARTLVFDPLLLLMDEPFGALDEITRESMRYELLRIWQSPLTNGGRRKTVIFVTHSIAEAVLLADRVVVLTGAPGRVRAVVEIDLPRPRTEATEASDEFRRYATELRSLLRSN